MQRNFLRGLLICLIPCLLAALFARRGRRSTGSASTSPAAPSSSTRSTSSGPSSAARSSRARRRRGDGPGPERRPEGLTAEEITDLAAQIKRRIDPTDIKNVTVRPVGDRRVEIILPDRRRAGGRQVEPDGRGHRGGQAAHLPDGRAGVPHPGQRPDDDDAERRDRRRRQKHDRAANPKPANWSGRDQARPTAGCRRPPPTASTTWTSTTPRPRSGTCGSNSGRRTARASG